MSTLLITGGRVIDPATGRDGIADLWLADGRIADRPGTHADETIDAAGMIVCPGLIDPRVALGEPGNEENETIATGTAAALAGGFTSIGAMPGPESAVDGRAGAEFVKLQGERARHCHVYALGSVTKRHEGKELSEIGQLLDGGAAAFTDGKLPIANSEVMRRALQYAGMWDRAILHHPQVPELVAGGVMNEGEQSVMLGLRGMPTAAEEIMVRRDIALAELTGGWVHLMAISSRNSVDEIRQARDRGLRITADVTPHHLNLTDESLQTYEANYKIDPPLRTREHIDALIEGLKDGTIEIICADHQPQAEEKKDRELDLAPFGIIGLETLIPQCVAALIEPGHLDWPALIRTLTVGPARLLNIHKGTLAPGADADVTIIDPQLHWTINAAAFASKSRNTPLNGHEVRGRAVCTIVSGDVRYRLHLPQPATG